MTTPTLVTDFYNRIWNSGDAVALPDILSADFSFRGSLGTEVKGHALFWEYVCGVRTALRDYHCDILGASSCLEALCGRVREILSEWISIHSGARSQAHVRTSIEGRRRRL